MQALIVPGAQGWQWLVEGYRIFRKNPALLSLLTMGYWLTILVVHSLPVLGPILASVGMPLLSVGMMTVCRAISVGEPAEPLLLYSAFKLPARRKLFALGAMYLLCSLFAVLLSTVVDGGALLDLMLGKKPLEDEDLVQGNYLAGMQAVMVIMIPAMMAWWYAPMLAAWHDFGISKALFFSFVACTRNWRAFLVYGLAVMFYMVILPMLAMVVLGAVFPVLKPILLTVLLVPVMLILAPSLFASFYVTYRDVLVVRENA